MWVVSYAAVESAIKRNVFADVFATAADRLQAASTEAGHPIPPDGNADRLLQAICCLPEQPLSAKIIMKGFVE